jgi:hypothetical protein
VVTICNINSFKIEFFLEYFKLKENLTFENDSVLSESVIKKEAARFLKSLTFDERLNFSYSFEEMFLSCEFNGADCLESGKFYKINKDIYLCFKFNLGNESTEMEKSSLVGLDFGLTLELVMSKYLIE